MLRFAHARKCSFIYSCSCSDMSIFARIVVILLVSCKGGRCCVSSTTARCQVVVGDIPLAELAEYTVSYTHYALQQCINSFNVF